MRPSGVPAVIAGLCFVISSISAIAQEPAPPKPAGSSGQLPPVEVIQKKATPAPKTAKKSAPRRRRSRRRLSLRRRRSVTEVPQTIPTRSMGRPPAAVRQRARLPGRQRPSTRHPCFPTNLRGSPLRQPSSTSRGLAERQPTDLNDALTRVPGVIVVNDDGIAHHGGIGIRGSPPRRSRKMLIMEDGHTDNMALWLDPSVHYWAPMDRIESIEVSAARS